MVVRATVSPMTGTYSVQPEQLGQVDQVPVLPAIVRVSPTDLRGHADTHAGPAFPSKGAGLGRLPGPAPAPGEDGAGGPGPC